MKKKQNGLILLIIGFSLGFQRTIISLLGKQNNTELLNDISGVLTVIGAMLEIIGLILLIKGIKETKKIN
ncbi:MAG: hypothetical protein WCK02_04630 [Bacteroidota bacterium]